ncbi:DNA-binding transcriptional MerR regulator [Inhella inkyongensis]|uniref:DNA-binding transcriptional MerR regulator n=1 Tax=Inhella inkyongensis TaxID=392593 RepID=A0A840SC25_9BURK|nr:MerR family transcriptional regulator [Inhella inkyongensis]MBB5206011.1 DNA-binding transcriptional MerR regulator [Inhella inkyongensis]
MRIGELAAAAATGADTIRFYEREGLMAAPPRSAANYRRYGPEHLQRLRLIRHARSLGLSLDEVRALLRALDQPASHHVDALVDQHLAHVRARIQELQALEQSLLALRTQCEGGRDACGILAGLQRAATESGGVPGPVVDGLHP